VVVDETRRLHEGVADRGTDEREAAPAQVLAHGSRFVRLGGDLAQRPPSVPDRLSADEAPDVPVEAPVFADDVEEGPGAPDSTLDLRPVADDARVA